MGEFYKKEELLNISIDKKNALSTTITALKTEIHFRKQ
jgi:hypothetical protein